MCLHLDSGFGQMYNDVSPFLKSHTQQFHCPKHPLCPTCSSLSQRQAATGPFTVSMVLPFPECPIVGIIHYAAFADRLLSLSNTHWSCLHVFSWLASSFLFSSESSSIVWMQSSWLIHSPNTWHVEPLITQTLGNNQTEAGISRGNVSQRVQLVRGHRREARVRPENSRSLILHFGLTDIPPNHRVPFYMAWPPDFSPHKMFSEFFCCCCLSNVFLC